MEFHMSFDLIVTNRFLTTLGSLWKYFLIRKIIKPKVIIIATRAMQPIVISDTN